MDGKGGGSLSSNESLPVVLNWLKRDLADLKEEVLELKESAQDTDENLGKVEDRIERTAKHLGIETSKQAPNRSLSLAAQRRDHYTDNVSWDALCDAARTSLEERSIEVDHVTLDELLDPEEARDIHLRFEGGLSIRTELDQYDVAVTVTAGLVAALVDLFIVQIPKDVVYLGVHSQTGSALTKTLRSLDMPADNWLARYFKVAYDRVKDVPVDGFYPRSHRLQSIGHDPLLGLVIGTVDIMRGGLTAISKSGTIHFLNRTGEAIPNPLTAFVFQLGHLLSDGFTPMGLPAPGWSALQLLQVGDFGTRHRNAAELARFMYLKGYDSRHFLTMSTSVAAAETVLRGYFALRQRLDPPYQIQIEHEAELNNTKRIGRHPRFLAMALGAHGIAAAANAGKVICLHANPLAINYSQWLRFLTAFFSWASQRRPSDSEALIMRAALNARDLHEGWPALDTDDPGFPSLRTNGDLNE